KEFHLIHGAVMVQEARSALLRFLHQTLVFYFHDRAPFFLELGIGKRRRPIGGAALHVQLVSEFMNDQIARRSRSIGLIYNIVPGQDDRSTMPSHAKHRYGFFFQEICAMRVSRHSESLRIDKNGSYARKVILF